MELDLYRLSEVNQATLGDLHVNSAPFCHTLEDVVRSLGPHGEGKVIHETAIPAGRYKVILTFSPKFQRILPWLQDVPFFDSILMHNGLCPEHTWGCILCGDKLDTEKGVIVPGTTHPAVDRLVAAMQAAVRAGEEIWITIHDSAVLG